MAKIFDTIALNAKTGIKRVIILLNTTSLPESRTALKARQTSNRRATGSARLRLDQKMRNLKYLELISSNWPFALISVRAAFS